MLIRTKGVNSLWPAQDKSEKYGRDLLAGFCDFASDSGPLWVERYFLLSCPTHNMERSGCGGGEIKWESIISHGLVVALSLDLGKDKVMGSKNNRMKLNQ